MSYIIKNNNGDYYSRTKTGRAYLTSTESKAIIFQDCKKAKNVLACLPKLLKKKGLTVCVCGKNADPIVDSNYINLVGDLKNTLTVLSDQCVRLRESKEQLLKQLSECDKKLTDLDHFIEFYSLSASEGYKISKMRKDILLDRRDIKNKLRQIDISENIAGIADDFECIKDKKYTPRILTDLFVEKESKISNKMN